MMIDSVQHEPTELCLPQAFLGWCALGIVLLSALAVGGNHPLSWTLVAMAILPLFFFQIVLDLSRGLPRSAVLSWPPILLFLGALGWAVVQITPNVAPQLAHPVWELVNSGTTYISADPIAGSQFVMRLSAYAMVFWIAVRASANAVRALTFLKAIGIFSTLLAGFGIWAIWNGENPILLDDATYALSATFINRNSYATYAVFGAVINLAIYLHLKGSGDVEENYYSSGIRLVFDKIFSGVWMFGLGTLLCLAAILLTQSRAGNVAGIIAVVTFLAVHRFQRKSINPYFLLSITAILGVMIYMLSSGLSERFVALSLEDSRFTIYPLVIEGIMNRPWLGHGLGAFHDTFRALVPIEFADVEWIYAHNSYLENAYELGLPAASAFYLALFWVMITITRGAFVRRRHRVFSCVALACIIAGGLHALFDFSLQMPATAALFSFIIGMGWAQSIRRHIRIPR